MQQSKTQNSKLKDKTYRLRQWWFISGSFNQQQTLQLLPGHSKFKGRVRYLGMEVYEALEISEQTEV
jgi:hypothetical protein